jgi:ubiquitin conjugation factor E4 B
LKTSRDSQDWSQQDARVKHAHEAQIKTYEKQLDVMIGQKLVMECGLLDKNTLEHLGRFYNLVIVWLIKNASGIKGKFDFAGLVRGNYSNVNLFPLDSLIPMCFATLPEWIIDDICDFYLFIVR